MVTERPAVEHVYTCPIGYSLAYWSSGNMDIPVMGIQIPETYGHYEKENKQQDTDIMRGGAPVCLFDTYPEPPKPNSYDVTHPPAISGIIMPGSLTISGGSVISQPKNSFLSAISDQPSCPYDPAYEEAGRCHVTLRFADLAGPIYPVCVRRKKLDNGWVVVDCSWKAPTPPKKEKSKP